MIGPNVRASDPPGLGPGDNPRVNSAVADGIRAYLDHLVVERGLAENTLSAYRRDLQRYADFLAELRIDSLGEVDRAIVTAHLVGLRETDPAPAEASVARALVAVRSLHRFAHEEGLTPDNPALAVRPPRAARRLPKALAIEQVQRLLDAPGTEDALALRDRALLELLYSTGARVSEVIALDVDGVSRLLDRPETVDGLRVLGKGSKERMVPLGSYAKRATTDYLVRARPGLVQRGRGTPALLLNARGGRLSRQSAWTIIQARAQQARLGVEVSPHTLRHSFATHLLDGGADVRVVQELLGHASVTTTQIYTLVTVDHLREVYLAAHPRAR